MSLTKKQMMEIAAFDWKRRTDGDFDGRRYGDVTGVHSPHYTEAMRPCYGAAVYAGAKKPSRKTLRYNYIVPVKARGKAANDRPGVVVVHVAVRLNGAYRQVVKEVGRWSIETGRLILRDIDFHGLGGWIVEWQPEDWAGGSERRKATDGTRRKPVLVGALPGRPIDDCWWDGGKWKFNSGLTFPYHETINLRALKGTKFEYCQYDDGTPCKAGLVDWLIMYRKEPKIELLAKAGLHPFVCPEGLRALKSKSIMQWVMSHREYLEKLFRGGTWRGELKDVLYAARHGVTVKQALSRRRFVEDSRRYLRGGPWPKFDYDRLRKALKRWGCSVAEYSRYLEHASDCGFDLRNDGTLYPPFKGGRKSFIERLERLERQAVRIRRAEERRRREERAAEEKWIRETMGVRIAELEAFQESMKRTDILKGSGYTLVVAKSQKELLAEGRRMGNCVGNGVYGKGVVAGDRMIVMLRRDGKSYCDIEIARSDWRVKQCYLKGNIVPPAAVMALAKKIAAWFKEEHRRHMKRGTFQALERKSA